MPNENNTIDVDALYEQVMSEQPSGWESDGQANEAETTPGEGANAETPTEAETKEPEPTGEANEFLEQFKTQQVPLKWGDSEKVVDGEKVIQYAQQGYDYNVKNRQLKQERQALEEKQQQWEVEQQEWKGKVIYCRNRAQALLFPRHQSLTCTNQRLLESM